MTDPQNDPTLPPQLRAALARMAKRGKVVELTSCHEMPAAPKETVRRRALLGKPAPYWLRVDGRVVMRGTLQEVQAYVAELATSLLAAHPVTFAEEAGALHMAFTGGTVAESLEQLGDWQTVVGEQTGQPVRLQVTKEE